MIARFSVFVRFFVRFANWTSAVTAHPSSFLAACAVIGIWGILGPIFNYSDTWQLVINTGTTIVTFLMVFLLQNSQNRSAKALQLKLDELIRSTRGAHNMLLDLEELSEEELDRIQKLYLRLAAEARRAGFNAAQDKGRPEVDFSGERGGDGNG